MLSSRPASVNDTSPKKISPPIIMEEDILKNEGLKTVSRPGSYIRQHNSSRNAGEIYQVELKKLSQLSLEKDSKDRENHTNNVVSYESGNETEKDVEVNKSGNMMRLSPGSKLSSVDHSGRSLGSRISQTDDANAIKTTDAVFTTEAQQQFQFFESREMDREQAEPDDENYMKLKFMTKDKISGDKGDDLLIEDDDIELQKQKGKMEVYDTQNSQDLLSLERSMDTDENITDENVTGDVPSRNQSSHYTASQMDKSAVTNVISQQHIEDPRFIKSDINSAIKPNESDKNAYGLPIYSGSHPSSMPSEAWNKENEQNDDEYGIVLVDKNSRNNLNIPEVKAMEVEPSPSFYKNQISPDFGEMSENNKTDYQQNFIQSMVQQPRNDK